MSAIYLPFVLLAIAAMPVARTETTAATQGFVTIVRMNNGAEVFTCAGALVAPDFVLTTAHCFCKGSKSCKTSAADYRALVGSNEYASTVAIEIRTISIHPAWTGDPSGGFDFAAVRLKEVANEVTDQARAVPIVMSHDRYCYDTLVQAYSWDGDELIRINGNTSDDQVGSRLVNETNKLLVNSTITYSWPQVCEQSNCEATQVVARGTSGSFCLLNDGAPLMLAGNGAEETGLVGLYSWALSSPPSNSSNSSDSACILKLKDGSVVSQFFAQASAAVEFLEAQGARLRVPVGPVCGDGRKSLYEACDDGNAVSGDGCSSNCTIESGWQCSTYHKTNLEQCWRSQCSSLKDDGDGSGLIVGIVVGCIAGAMALCAIPTIIIRRRRRERAAAKATTRATPAPPAAGATTTDRNPRRTTRKAPEDLPVVMAENTDTLVSTPVTALKHGAPPPTPAADPIWTAGSPTAPSASTVGLPENGSRVLTPAALRLDTPASPGNARTAASGGNRLAGIVRPTPVRSDNAPLSPFRRDSTDSQSRSPLTSSRD